jgi:hypothetical protein
VRLLAIQTIIENNTLFDTSALTPEFVPALIKEFKQGWNTGENWILCNLNQVIKFLMERSLIDDVYVDSLYKFFDVLVHLTL